jgi:PAS domain-containing protein
MSNLNTLLLEQLKGLGIDPNTESPTSEQWSQLLNLVSLTYAEVDYERTLQKEAQVSSAHVLKKLHNNLEESQRISGFGRWSFNLQSKIGDWTNECSRVFGLTPFSSMPSYRVLARKIQKDDRIHLKRKLKALMLEGKNVELECRIFLEGGESRWALVKAEAIKDIHGEIVNLSGTTLDITPRKVAQLRQTIEHAITRMLAEHPSKGDVISEIIQTVCEALNWVGGSYWVINKPHNA